MNGLLVLVTLLQAPAPGSIEEARASRQDARAKKARKDYRGCASSFGEASQHMTNYVQNDHYNAACCWALAAEPGRAFEQLRAAAEQGFRMTDHMQRDEDLVSLHGDARWQKTLQAVRAKERAYLHGANRELLQIFEADQEGRRRNPPVIDNDADASRRKQVEAIVTRGEAKSSDDYYHAAMVFQHGSTVEDYRRAHAWARKAVERDPKNRRARWLVAATKDRELMTLGKPQLYGTQYQCGPEHCSLYPVDLSVTDHERARWNVPPLQEAQERAASMRKSVPSEPLLHTPATLQ